MTTERPDWIPAMQRVRRGVGVEVTTMQRVMRMRAGAGRSGIHGWRVALLPVVAPG